MHDFVGKSICSVPGKKFIIRIIGIMNPINQVRQN